MFKTIKRWLRGEKKPVVKARDFRPRISTQDNVRRRLEEALSEQGISAARRKALNDALVELDL